MYNNVYKCITYSDMYEQVHCCGAQTNPEGCPQSLEVFFYVGKVYLLYTCVQYVLICVYVCV